MNSKSINKGIKGITDHSYYCEAYEMGCKTTNFNSFKEYLSSEEFKSCKKKILFRFDIDEDIKDDVFKLKLHYGDPNDMEGLYHHVINITLADFSMIEELLKKAYKTLLTIFHVKRIKDHEPFYTDTCSADYVLAEMKSESVLDWNLPYHYIWYKDENGKLGIVICCAGQTHGRSQWIVRIPEITEEEKKRIKEFLRSTAFKHIKQLWCEIS